MYSIDVDTNDTNEELLNSTSSRVNTSSTVSSSSCFERIRRCVRTDWFKMCMVICVLTIGCVIIFKLHQLCFGVMCLQW
jgi:hypothetical protein